MTQDRNHVAFSPDAELVALHEILSGDDPPVFYASMERHFRVAREKPERFSNSMPCLGVSIGGTNTKIAVSSMQAGSLLVHHARSIKNPSAPTRLGDFLDSIFIADATIMRFLRAGSLGACAFAFPMAVIDGKPFHQTKLPTIGGLVSRDKGDLDASPPFSAVFERYCASRGIPAPRLFSQGDGIVAHHGALALSDLVKGERSTLLICGTGLALGDEMNYVQLGLAQTLGNDPELFPAEQTEGGQIQYALAGKGLFSLMRRLVDLRAREPGSILAGWDAGIHFRNADDSRLVADLWNGGRPLPAERVAELMAELHADERLVHGLCQIASAIMARVPVSLANCILATVASMDLGEDCGEHVLFLEGSVAKSPPVSSGIRTELERRLAGRSSLPIIGRAMPPSFRHDPPLRKVLPAAGLSSAVIADFDLTLVGAVTSAVAEAALA